MRSYELMIIHRPELAETDVRNAIGQAEAALSANGARCVWVMAPRSRTWSFRCAPNGR